MSVFTNPVTLTITAGDRDFTFRGQILDAKAFIGAWIESTTGVNPALESVLMVKHTETGTLNRRLLQRKTSLAPISGSTTRRPITINKSFIYDDNVTQAELEAENDIMVAAEAVTGFFDRFCRSEI